MDTDGRSVLVGGGIALLGVGGYAGYHGFYNNFPRWETTPFGGPSASELATLDYNENVWTPDRHMRFVRVRKCEMVFVFGHGAESGLSYSFQFPDNGCPASGGFYGCFSDQQNQRIRPNNRIPGSPIAGRESDGSVSPEDLWMTQSEWPYLGNELTDTIKNVGTGMARQANDWLRNNKNCCPCVVITVVRGDTINPASTPKKFASLQICKPVRMVSYDWNKNVLSAR